MKFNKWTVALAAAGVVSLGTVAMAEESPVTSKLSPTSLSGYVSTSAIWKFGTGNSAFDGRSYDGGKQDGFNLDVVKVSLSKDLAYTGQWEAGYKFDALFGPDAGTFANGISNNGHDLAIENAYVLLNAPAPVGSGVDIKMGVFDTLVGYEVFDYPSNPNYSRSYGYLMEPLQHTGVTLASQLNSWLRIEAGVANTFDGPINGKATFVNGEQSETEKTYLGLVTLTAPESFGFLAKSQLYLGAVNGNGFGQSYHTTHWYAGGNFNTPVEGLKLAAAFDYRDQNSKREINLDNGILGWDDVFTASDSAWTIAGYLIYDLNPKLTLANRFEYVEFNAASGTDLPDVNVIADTVTLDYKLWANVKTRLEFRWDGSLDSDVKPYGYTDQNAISLALNVIYQF
jgi:hypothetical protein